MSGIPLLAPRDLARTFARRGDAVITGADFLCEVQALAAVLPQARHVANLCQDRVRFAVGFAAALVRGQVTLLPPSEAPGVLDSVLSGYDDCYCLTDGDLPVAAREYRYPQHLPAGDVIMPEIPANQIAAVLYTSGSTGAPQPHPRSWGLLVSSADSAGREIGADRLPGASLIGTVPHQHSYGLESLIMLAFRHALVLHAERPFYPQDIAASLQRAPAPRILVTTPVHLRVLLAEAASLPQADLVLSATAPLDEALACAAEEGFGARLYEIYGCSEVGQLAARRTMHGLEWRCLDGIALRQQAGATFATGARIAAPTRLGDIIELRDSRHFRLLGRDSDLVNIAGKRHSLAALAALLCSLEGVHDAVFMMREGQGRPIAFAVAPGMDGSALLAALRGRVDPAFLPRRLHLVERLPRNALGKITQAALALLAESARR